MYDNENNENYQRPNGNHEETFNKHVRKRMHVERNVRIASQRV
jgi:hypothetical protein